MSKTINREDSTWVKIRKPVTAVLVVCAVCAMGYTLFWPADDLATVPDTEESASAWGCRECGFTEMLTDRQRVIRQREGSGMETSKMKTEQGEAATSLRQLMLTCKQCKQMQVMPGVRCSGCDTPYAQLVKGLPRPCPKCGKDHHTESKPAKPATRSRPSQDDDAYGG